MIRPIMPGTELSISSNDWDKIVLFLILRSKNNELPEKINPTAERGFILAVSGKEFTINELSHCQPNKHMSPIRIMVTLAILEKCCKKETIPCFGFKSVFISSAIHVA